MLWEEIKTFIDIWAKISLTNVMQSKKAHK